jgi:hypothetical protein
MEEINNIHDILIMLAALVIIFIMFFGYNMIPSAKQNVTVTTEILTVSASASSGMPVDAPLPGLLTYTINTNVQYGLSPAPDEDVTVVPVYSFKGTDKKGEPFIIKKDMLQDSYTSIIRIDTRAPPLDYGGQSADIDSINGGRGMVEGESYKFGPERDITNYRVTLLKVDYSNLAKKITPDNLEPLVLTCAANFLVECKNTIESTGRLQTCDDAALPDDDCRSTMRMCGGDVIITVTGQTDCSGGRAYGVHVETTPTDYTFDALEKIGLYFFKDSACVEKASTLDGLRTCVYVDKYGNQQNALLGNAVATFKSARD